MALGNGALFRVVTEKPYNTIAGNDRDGFIRAAKQCTSFIQEKKFTYTLTKTTDGVVERLTHEGRIIYEATDNDTIDALETRFKNNVLQIIADAKAMEWTTRLKYERDVKAALDMVRKGAIEESKLNNARDTLTKCKKEYGARFPMILGVIDKILGVITKVLIIAKAVAS